MTKDPAKRKAARKRSYQEAIRRGLCVNWCGRKSTFVGHTCEPCRKKTAVAKKKWLEAARAQGLCQNGCGKRSVKGRVYCQECRAKKTEMAALRRERLKLDGRCACGHKSKATTRSCERCIEYGKSAQLRIKLAVVNHYGDCCACCGESNIRFLSVDHINNDGAEHRRKISNGGRAPHFYTWIINNGFPDFLQLLCFNCNFGKGKNGGVCPHEEARVRAIS